MEIDGTQFGSFEIGESRVKTDDGQTTVPKTDRDVRKTVTATWFKIAPEAGL